MINPIPCVVELTKDDASHSEMLIDLLLWATQPNVDIRKTAEYDRVVELLYSQTRDAAQHRENYLSSREVGAVITPAPH